MTAVLGAFLVATAILLVICAPTLYLAWRKGHTKTVGRFLIAAGSVGLVLATLSGSSDVLLNQCQAVNGRDCVDAGSAGMRLTILGMFAIVAWTKAVILYNE